MALSNINYVPTIAGTQIKNDLKNSNFRITNAIQASQIWRVILGDIYGDFASMLSTTILAYLNSAQCQFMPASPYPLIVPSLVLTEFNTQARVTANTIISDFQSQNFNNSDPAETTARKAWTVIFKDIFIDIVNIIGKQVAAACNQSTTIAGVGAVAAPHTGLSVSVPATLTNSFVENDLKTIMQAYYNENTARSEASSLVNEIKTQHSNKPAESASTAIWQSVINRLKIGINTQISNHIKTFLSTKQYFTIPLGAPGNVPGPGTVATTGTVYCTIF